MNILSTWLARQKRRRASRKLMRKLLAGIERRVPFEREIWDDYAIAIGKSAETLTLKEKQKAVPPPISPIQEQIGTFT